MLRLVLRPPPLHLRRGTRHSAEVRVIARHRRVLLSPGAQGVDRRSEGRQPLHQLALERRICIGCFVVDVCEARRRLARLHCRLEVLHSPHVSARGAKQGQQPRLRQGGSRRLLRHGLGSRDLLGTQVLKLEVCCSLGGRCRDALEGGPHGRLALVERLVERVDVRGSTLQHSVQSALVELPGWKMLEIVKRRVEV